MKKLLFLSLLILALINQSNAESTSDIGQENSIEKLDLLEKNIEFWEKECNEKFTAFAIGELAFFDIMPVSDELDNWKHHLSFQQKIIELMI